MATEPTPRSAPEPPGGADEVENLVAEFILEREEGKNPSIDDYLTRHPKHAEALARLLSYETHPPARRTTTPAPGVPDAPAGGSKPAPRVSGGAEPVRLGPYEVVEHVSTAGGGTVYRARHVDAGHVVALKVLDTRGAVDLRDIERFRREAAMLRALDLVHVVPVLDTGEDGGRFWIAMKWLEGDTLGKLREAVREKSHPLRDQRERARLVARVARTFAAIHACGILHRDVKPTNIMVDRTGEPMIIDFGIAQAPDLPELTATTDQLMGTPRYLAPELLAGGNRQVSPRTDVYGLGLCLYELCTGVEAFKHETRADLFTAIRTAGPLHPGKTHPAVSHDLCAVILRAIEIDPARRYQDMTAFADDLERFARGESPELATLRGAHPLLRALRRNRKRLIGAACLALVLVPAISIGVSRSLSEMRARRAEAVLEPFAWFPPEAFAGGVGIPSRSIAEDLAESDAPERRLIAAWIPFLSGDFKEALGHLGTPLPGDGFATRLFRAHLSALESAPEGHAFMRTIDPRTQNPPVNPLTGEEMVFLVPADEDIRVRTVDPRRFDDTVEECCAAVPPVSPVDHMVLATLHWSVVKNDPGADTASRRSGIEQSLSKLADEKATRVPARHLRGVMRFLAGDLPHARDDLAEVIASQPAALGSRYLLGIVLTRLGDPRGGCAHLEIVARDLPRTHIGRARMLGHLAIARARSGSPDRGQAACDEWLAHHQKEGSWQDAVIPRVIAAQLWRQHGDLLRARDLLVAAVEEDQRIKLLEKGREEREGEEQTAPLLWEPALAELCEVAEALGDSALRQKYREKMQRVGLQPIPKSAEAYLDLNLAGLRQADFDRVMYPDPQRLPRNQ